MEDTTSRRAMRRLLGRPADLTLATLVVLATAVGLQVGQAPTASAAPAAAGDGLSLSASAGPTTVSRVGQAVAYAVVVTNRGTSSLTNLLVSDPTSGLSALVCSPVAQGGTLAGGASTTCRATRTTTAADLAGASLTDTVRASAKAAGGAVNAATSVSVATGALPPKATDDTVGAVDGGPDVLLAGASNDQPGEAGGPAVDPSRTVFTGVPVNAGDDGRQAADDGGTWSTLPDGRVRMTPGYKRGGRDSTIAYTVYDVAGHSSVGHLRVHVRPGPAPVDNRATTPQGKPVTVAVLGNDDPGQNVDGTRSAYDPTSLRMSGSGLPDYPTTLDPEGRSLDLAGAGRFAVVDGAVVFTPVTGFVGTATAFYGARTTSGIRVDAKVVVDVQAVAGGPAPVRPTQPVATDDHVVTTTQLATALPAQRNDVPGPDPFVNSKLTFPGDQLASLPTGSTIVYSDGVRLTVPGQGTYLARFGTQDVLFTPAKGFIGDAAPVDYRVTDTAGRTARATLSVTVLPGITARWDYAKTRQGHRVLTDVRANDDQGVSPTTWTALPVSTPRLTARGNPGAVLSGTYQQKLVVPGQGVFMVSPGNGVVTFDPEPRFVGTSVVTLGVQYQVQRPVVGTETLAFETKLSVTVLASTPVARTDSASTASGRPVVVPVLTNDSPGSPVVPLVGSSVRLRLTAGLPTGSTLAGDAKTLVVAGRGTFLVAGTGDVTFVPLGASTGKVPTVGYQVADANGTTARSSITVTVG
ncbi:hypothetical protein GCM10022197_35930 [Microlunatus spumicola]|uniref:Uncharacterized protein n=1 Tax=Microlunatus spumicola TaxID=81499 RepID=A0ABP6Y2Y9_9ACTN